MLGRSKHTLATQTRNTVYIYWHLGYLWGKCWQIYQTWVAWERKHGEHESSTHEKNAADRISLTSVGQSQITTDNSDPRFGEKSWWVSIEWRPSGLKKKRRSSDGSTWPTCSTCSQMSLFYSCQGQNWKLSRPMSTLRSFFIKLSLRFSKWRYLRPHRQVGFLTMAPKWNPTSQTLTSQTRQLLGSQKLVCLNHLPDHRFQQTAWDSHWAIKATETANS